MWAYFPLAFFIRFLILWAGAGCRGSDRPTAGWRVDVDIMFVCPQPCFSPLARYMLYARAVECCEVRSHNRGQNREKHTKISENNIFFLGCHYFSLFFLGLSMVFLWTFSRDVFPKIPSKYPRTPYEIFPFFSVLTPAYSSPSAIQATPPVTCALTRVLGREKSVNKVYSSIRPYGQTSQKQVKNFKKHLKAVNQ